MPSVDLFQRARGTLGSRRAWTLRGVRRGGLTHGHECTWRAPRSHASHADFPSTLETDLVLGPGPNRGENRDLTLLKTLRPDADAQQEPGGR